MSQAESLKYFFHNVVVEVTGTQNILPMVNYVSALFDKLYLYVVFIH